MLDSGRERVALTVVRALPILRWIALILGALGVAALLALGFTTDANVAAIFADFGIALLALAVSAGVLRGAIRIRMGLRHSDKSYDAASQLQVGRCASSKWWALLVLVIAVAATISWFEPGTVFAGGDDTPPVGLAWISHLFDAWAWTGSNLGQPNTYQGTLPWAAMLEAVHWLGGSAGMAQQIWFTVLFAGGGVGAFGLLRLLRIAPAAAFAGALAYLFNPYVLSFVNNNPVFLATMAAVAAVGCCVAGVGSGRLTRRVGTILIALISPLQGYAFANPPTLLVFIGAAVVTSVACYVVYGREGLDRCLRLACWAIPLFVLVSAYWLVPDLIASTWAATSQLNPLATWTWTEIRSTLANAFWLNTQWSWKFKWFFPFESEYGHFPMLLLRYLLPVTAFAAVPLAFTSARRQLASRGLVLLAAGMALLLIFISTGTRAPGDVLFNPLYSLPLGWLLREPERFLLGAALAYAILLAVTVQALAGLVGGLPSPRAFWRTWTVPQGAMA
ncbi:MAG TPA: hypothetical protein VME01_01340, partial [Solirubrobacteraceae bacterium]|nr:hypothetical protein [Solirubrobacteraceae bacterium]